MQPEDRDDPTLEAVSQLESASPEQTYELGRRLGTLLAAGDVVGLCGDLGAGKTLFTRGVGVGMGADRRYRVASPTFTLINEHPRVASDADLAGRPKKLVHVDLYRLEELDEMVEIGLFDYLGGDGACLVEWFDRLAGEEPAERLELRLEATGDERRRLTARAFGERHRQLLQAWLHEHRQDRGEGADEDDEEEAR
ncbi:MAG: tRNA (adenosine(37)-N6)-threonylcarbamoyltransferase complex ATPase subunit type 1 TsaE [Proteobacteria bacterium]|nr:MAG: tRNA (adenosine(37)-N6)-threonylcarbamoyltransferase complex ATPase subunit type 1 TsaE [Pseudomonadota bacterium]